MRICDRCGKKAVKETLKSRQDDTEYDLCLSCREMFSEWIFNKPAPAQDPVQESAQSKKRGPGRPPKEAAR